MWLTLHPTHLNMAPYRSFQDDTFHEKEPYFLISFRVTKVA